MNKDQITKIALMSECFIMDTGQINTDDIDLEVFANLVAAAEREACAKLCDENTNPNADKYAPVGQYEGGCYITAEYLAAAIRERGQG